MPTNGAERLTKQQQQQQTTSHVLKQKFMKH